MNEYVSIVVCRKNDSLNIEAASVDFSEQLVSFNPKRYLGLFALSQQSPPAIENDHHVQWMLRVSGYSPRMFLMKKEIAEKQFACTAHSMHNDKQDDPNGGNNDSRTTG